VLLRPLEHTDFVKNIFFYLDYSTDNRRILHQTLSNMFNSIMDSIDKPSSHDISSYQSTGQRTSIDDHNLNTITVENHDRFRKFLQLAIDYIYSFHNECQYFENLTLRLLDICLLGIAYLIEKRSNHSNTRHQMSLIIHRCSDIIKQIGQKLLTIALDPERQRFFFRIQILKHIIDQPNVKAIMEYLLANDTQCLIYHQILIYVQKLSKTKPNDFDFEQINNQSSSEQSRKSFDSGHSTIATIINTTHRISNGEDSSHTVNISTKSNTIKQLKSVTKHQAKSNISHKQLSTPDEDEPDFSQLSSSSTTDEEREIRVRKVSERSSSLSLSISSISSELTTLHQSSIINYQNIITLFRDRMRTVNIQSLTTNDSNAGQRRALTDHLLMSSTSSTCKIFKIYKKNSFFLIFI